MQGLLTFESGEIRKFEYYVSSQSVDDVVIITKAKWELSKKTDNSILAEGDCEVDENRISMLVNLSLRPGEYNIKVTAEIPPEVIIEILTVRVI